MKVMCINASTDDDSQLPVDVSEGEVYTVTDSSFEDDILWYSLAERSEDDEYSSDGFIPLSDIDEMELIEQRELITV